MIRVAANGGIRVAADGVIRVAANGGICVAHPFSFVVVLLCVFTF